MPMDDWPPPHAMPFPEALARFSARVMDRCDRSTLDILMNRVGDQRSAFHRLIAAIARGQARVPWLVERSLLNQLCQEAIGQDGPLTLALCGSCLFAFPGAGGWECPFCKRRDATKDLV